MACMNIGGGGGDLNSLSDRQCRRADNPASLTSKRSDTQTFPSPSASASFASSIASAGVWVWPGSK
ncbi:hypothetical protein [Oceanicoccus sp. KOV_DT_Chl]|uniref:hypothetical protein n=1 Tax=Oceanicoccus sp. KOV_DT_Chl TaxID=1904639 RepID=UPI000C7CD0C3|nr:hypothetical protein [Oceanicoccus sp. KOV_DT_Chl]